MDLGAPALWPTVSSVKFETFGRALPTPSFFIKSTRDCFWNLGRGMKLFAATIIFLISLWSIFRSVPVNAERGTRCRDSAYDYDFRIGYR